MNYFCAVLLFVSLRVFPQSDTLSTNMPLLNASKNFQFEQLIVPTTLVATAILGRHIPSHQAIDLWGKDKVLTHFGSKTKVDDYLQYTPIIATFTLSNLGIKPKYSLKERLVAGATAHIIMAISVNTIKHTARILRPDNTALNSFPSGHTATAFTGAEMLWQEYKDQNIWIGISGYTMASITGLLRVYNNRHWLTDVLAGAGIGMLSTKIAYGLLPTISKIFFAKKHEESQEYSFLMYPVYASDIKGLGICIAF